MSRWSNVRFFAIVSITFATFICGRNDASAGVAVIDSVTHTHGAIDNVYISAHFDWTSSNAAAAWFIWEDKGADQVSFASDLGKGPA
ncbi:MAG: hypothetical protein NTX57_22930, partial [Armatimonadetes bacterium]|nr:hypothetical protein [Armatimonadota bacterium]